MVCIDFTGGNPLLGDDTNPDDELDPLGTSDPNLQTRLNAIAFTQRPNGKGNKRKRTGRPNGNYSAETRAAAAVDGFELGVPRAIAKWSAELNLEDSLPEAI